MLRLTLSAFVGCVGLFGAWHHLRPCHASADTTTAGRYVEARTASVFAGACHYNGELVTDGREAVLAWHFDRGAEQGVELAGLEAVAVVRATENLKLTALDRAESGRAAERRSIVYVPAALGERERDALVAAVRRHAADAIGEIVEVRGAELSVRFDGDAYRVEVAGAAEPAVELVGSLDADRACCRMPQNVWYEPLVPLSAPVVGKSETFAFRDAGFGSTWVRHDANDAFVGAFGGCGDAPTRRPSCAVATVADAD